MKNYDKTSVHKSKNTSNAENISKSGSNTKIIKQSQELERKEWSQLLEINKKEPSFEGQIPHLEQPKAFKIKLFPGYYFVQVKKPFRGLLDLNQPRYFESTNTLDIDIDYWISESSKSKTEKLEENLRQKIAQKRLEEANRHGGNGPYIFSNITSHQTKTGNSRTSNSQNTISNYTNTVSKESSQFDSRNISTGKNSKETSNMTESNSISQTVSGTVSQTISATASNTVTARGESTGIQSVTHSNEPSSGRYTETSRFSPVDPASVINEIKNENQQDSTPNTEINKISNSKDQLEKDKNSNTENIIQTSEIINEEQELIPSKPKIETGHYLLLEFDEHHQVSKIEYFGRDEPSLECLVNLCGLHRSFFNLMFERKQAGLVNDFATFISQEWASFLGHPVFPQLAKYARGLFHLTFRKHNYSSRTLELAYAEGLSLMRKKLISESKIQENKKNKPNNNLIETDTIIAESLVKNQNEKPLGSIDNSANKAHLNLKDCQKDQMTFHNNLSQYQTEQYVDQKDREIRERVQISKTEHIWDDLLSELPHNLKQDLLEQIECCISRFRPVFSKHSV